MGSFNVNMLILLEILTDTGQGCAQLVVLLWHWIQGDDGVVLMLPCWFSTQSNSTAGWSIPTISICRSPTRKGRGFTGKLAMSSSEPAGLPTGGARWVGFSRAGALGFSRTGVLGFSGEIGGDWDERGG